MSGRSYAKLFFSRGNQNTVRRVASQGRKERKVPFMKKVLMVVAMLLLATPVFAADVTITATASGVINKTEPNWTQSVTVGWTGAASADSIRAFALILTADGGKNLDNIGGFVKGESNATSKGYGVFPGKFRQYVDVLSPTQSDWLTDSNYNPIAPATDYNSGGYSNTPRLVVELGTLYQGDANAPGTSGTLFTIDVNNENFFAGHGTDCNMCIALEQTRGGVVKKDGTAATFTLPGTGGCIKVSFPECQTPANEVGQTVATATAAWTAAGFTNLVGTPGTAACPANVVQTNDQACIAFTDALNYTYSVAPAEVNVAGMTRTAAVAALTAQGFVIGADINVPPTATVTALRSVTTQSPVAGSTPGCGATVRLGVVSYPIKEMTLANSMYVNWVTNGRPLCWGYPRQCHGDADGKKQVSYWVGTNDLAVLKAAISKATLPAGGACADFDHKKQVSYWVGTNDLAILKAYISKAEASVPICGNTSITTDPNFWYWCLPTGIACPTSPAGQVCAPAGVCPNTP